MDLGALSGQHAPPIVSVCVRRPRRFIFLLRSRLRECSSAAAAALTTHSRGLSFVMTLAEVGVVMEREGMYGFG